MCDGLGSKRSTPFVVLCLTVAALLFLAGSNLTRAAWAGSDDDNEIMFKSFKHPVVGSWFGKAQQVCPTGADPAINCIGLGPAIPLFTTPTLTDGGIFLGSDSHELGGAPFAPHTAAHGSWRPLGKTGFRADYVFMLPTYAPFPPSRPNRERSPRCAFGGTVRSSTRRWQPAR